jgi:hypothetical protein
MTASPPSSASAKDWLTRLFDRLESWSSALQMLEVEAYLAQAQDAADLERRINHLQDGRRSQALLMR